jgi:uncharacterized membrane protein SpoIIM required for sporulation
LILDFDRFVQNERPHWLELESMLAHIERRTGDTPALAESRRLYYLYRRAASAMSQMGTYSGHDETVRYLEDLVARAHLEIHESRGAVVLPKAWKWLTGQAPRTVRRHGIALGLSTLLMLLGAALGGVLLLVDEEAKLTLMPFSHLMGDPSERVAREEAEIREGLAERHATFSAQLMTNNIRVSFLAMALGVTYALGTAIMLFYNGAILGAVVVDYLRAGEGVFLTGWLLPHGSVEIPAILFAGQAGLMLGYAMIGWGNSLRLRDRMRLILPDVLSILALVVVLLIWAGLVESFFSQYHEPTIPYAVKIAFGGTQLMLLGAYLLLAGRRSREVTAA